MIRCPHPGCRGRMFAQDGGADRACILCGRGLDSAPDQDPRRVCSTPTCLRDAADGDARCVNHRGIARRQAARRLRVEKELAG